MSRLCWFFLLALSAGFLTFISALLNDARLHIALYRSAVSASLFAGLGFAASYAVKKLNHKAMDDPVESKGNNIDLVSDTDALPESAYVTDKETEFRPLNTEIIEKIYKSS